MHNTVISKWERKGGYKVFETWGKPSMNLKFVNSDGLVRKKKKYPISNDGKKIVITKIGGSGNPNPEFNHYSVRKKKNHWLKLWRPGTEYWCETIPGAKHCIEFKPKEVIVHPADPELVEALASAGILTKWGEKEKQPFIFYMNLALSFLIFLFMLLNSGMINIVR